MPLWIELPKDLTSNILDRLGAVEILENAQIVCTTWLNVCKDPLMWRVIDMKNKVSHDEEDPDRLYLAFRRAVDLSQGQLIDFRFDDFGSYDWLYHLTERSTLLRCLRLASCSGIKGKYLSEQLVKFKMLEELHICYMRKSVSAKNIEAIGRSCSKLTVFTLDHQGFSEPTIVSDGLALAVANSMPSLLHLRLFGNKLSNKGLQALLDGCPDLESLDIRKCLNVVLVGDLGNICSQQIKSLKRQLDSTANECVPDFERFSLDDNDYEDNNSSFYDSDTDFDVDYSWCRCSWCYDDFRAGSDYDNVSDQDLDGLDS